MTIDEWLKADRPWNIILHGDCMELMQHLEDKSINIACVDPPYGIKRFEKGSLRFDRNNDYTNGLKWDKNPDTVYFNELFRISSNQIIWGANNFILPETEYFVIWDKQQTVDNFASAEYAWTNIRKPAKIYKYSIHQHNKISKIHPTQKPIALYRWLLQNYAKPGDKIIDTHSGSGSCAIACFLEHHDFLAIEKDADYHAASVKRFEEIKAQGRLF